MAPPLRQTLGSPAGRMNQISLDEFRREIGAKLGQDARIRAVQTVKESASGAMLWHGDVLVFEVGEQPTIRTCYAWEVKGVVTLVPESDAVRSAREAVLSTLAAARADPLA